MKKLFIIFLLLSSTTCWALPQCRGNNPTAWHACIGYGVWPNGDTYTGSFYNGKYSGHGTYTWGSGPHKGDKYVGDFVDEKKHGTGLYTFANGDTYEGDYIYDVPDGYGIMTWNSTRQIMNGSGRYVQVQAGDKYVGQNNQGLLNGQGIYYHVDGRVREGIWENDEFIFAKKIIQENPTPEYTSPENEIPESDPYELYDDNEIMFASSGTGFAVSSSGHVVTNYHVARRCKNIYIHFQGKKIPSTVISTDTTNDLALIKSDFKPTTIFAFSKESPSLTQKIYVAGFPFGRDEVVSSSIKVTSGIISALAGLENNFSNIQIDAAIQVGNSGGPIVNDKGNVVGVAVAKADPEYFFKEYGAIPENTNFGVKSNVVISFLESNSIKLKNPNSKIMSTKMLDKTLSEATYYLSCYMTVAQIKEEIRNEEYQKAMFKNIVEEFK
tara:strand:- start:132 stop:1448 length:1317 start_codon:yes stop_codon:yes gene_type:complete